MNQDQKIDAAIEFLISKGVEPQYAYPFYFKWMRKIGITLKPPLFMNQILLATVWFAIACGFVIGVYHSMNILSDETWGVGMYVQIFTIPAIFTWVIVRNNNVRRKVFDLPTWDEITSQ